jgi:hypothetical protein
MVCPSTLYISTCSCFMRRWCRGFPHWLLSPPSSSLLQSRCTGPDIPFCHSIHLLSVLCSCPIVPEVCVLSPIDHLHFLRPLDNVNFPLSGEISSCWIDLIEYGGRAFTETFDCCLLSEALNAIWKALLREEVINRTDPQ